MEYLEWQGTSVYSASKFCSRDTNCLWFKVLASMKVTNFTNVLVTCFTLNNFAEYLLMNNTVKEQYFSIGTEIILHPFEKA